jgi:hypothetical protein
MKMCLAITNSEVTMNEDEASRLISTVDDDDHDNRVARLVEMEGLLPTSSELMEFAGQEAKWLFDDVKATWLYGCFTSTVLTAYAFCLLQLANAIRMLPDDPGLPDEPGSLEELAAIAAAREVIDIELQARVLALHDRQRIYSAAPLHEHEFRLERHLVEAQSMSDEHALVVDARQALTTAIEIVRAV